MTELKDVVPGHEYLNSDQGVLVYFDEVWKFTVPGHEYLNSDQGVLIYFDEMSDIAARENDNG